jgi:hypothetical protein
LADDEPDAEGPGPDPPPSPSEAELLAELERELATLKVSDVIVQTVLTLSSLGYRRLEAEHRDLAQARLAIDALRALLPVLAPAVPEQTSRDFGQMVSNMQLAYASAAAESPRGASEGQGWG